MLRTEPFQTLDELVEYFSHDKIQCLICGEWRNSLNRAHLETHFLTAKEYKLKYGIPIRKGLLGVNFYIKLSNSYATDKKLGTGNLETTRLKNAAASHCSCGLKLTLDYRKCKVCKPCRFKKAKEYRLKNIEKLKKYHVEYRLKNMGEDYKLQNREKHKLYMREYRRKKKAKT